VARAKVADRLKQLEFDVKLAGLALLARRAPKPGRYLLCRPRGGLNDCLRQLQKCWRYAVLHRRTLIVDTAGFAVMSPFGRYFEPRRAGASFVLTLEPELLAELETLECQVPSITGRIGSYEAVFEGKQMFEKDSGELLTFDFRRPHDAPLLVHHQCGGGLGIGFLSQVRLTPDVAEVVRERLALLPPGYLGLHVRNSDVKSDYKAFFEAVRAELEGERVLVCSDDSACIDYARDFFTKSEVLAISEIPDTRGRRLWDFTGQDDWKSNVDSLVDVLALAHARRILRPEPPIGYPSGFSRLAIELHNRPWLLSGLLGPRG
jgi:hypothetical protein